MKKQIKTKKKSKKREIEMKFRVKDPKGTLKEIEVVPDDKVSPPPSNTPKKPISTQKTKIEEEK